MLRKNTFLNIAKRHLNPGILRTLSDFLSDRKCVVEVDGKCSDVCLGCVQGSVLGPKLFNIYTSEIRKHLTKSPEITTYADDSYVINSDNMDSLITETEECLCCHTEYLRSLGMVVNSEKTEVMYIQRQGKPESLTIRCVNIAIQTQNEIKILGVALDNRLTWYNDISKTVNKLSRLMNGLKFIRKRLTEQQFIKVLTSQYYGMCYHGCQAWL